MTRAFVRAALPLTLVVLALLAIALLPSVNWADDGTGEVNDLDNDGVRDKVEADSEGGGASRPGEVEIRSGTYGQLIVRFRGTTPDGRFGYSVGVADDLNLDGERDVIIGAPAEDAGRVYVFYGPFNTGPLTLQPDSAGLTLISPRRTGPEADYLFGERVAPASDVDGDGVTDIRIRAWFERDGIEISRTYIVSGIDGAPLLVIEGTDPFDPWYEIEGDLDGDGDVDADDEAIVWSNLGLTGEPGSLGLSVGDVNGDGVVNGADAAIVQGNLGMNLFVGIWLPCDGNPLPPGMLCMVRCDGLEWLLAENADRECDPILCPQNCACTYQVVPEPWNGIATPHQVDRGIETTIHVVADLNDCPIWTIVQGQSAIENVVADCNQFTFTGIEYGASVIIRAEYNCCAGSCSLEIPFFITCNGIPDPAEDDDFDGLNNWEEICILGTDKELIDTDGDGMTDGWEVLYGFDPLFAGDAAHDPDFDGIPNVLESLYGSNPLVHNDVDPNGLDPALDSDGDGFIDWLEEQFGTDPFNAASVPLVSDLYIDPGDMSWMVVNEIVQDVNGTNINMCEGDCFWLHGTGWASSWTVVQGQDILYEFEPDSPDGCISAKWCITGTGDITILASTPSGPGIPPRIAFVHINAQPAGTCPPPCKLTITLPGGEELPEYVCADEVIFLNADPDQNNSGCDCTGAFEWRVESSVPGAAEFFGSPGGSQAMLHVLKPGEIYVTAVRGGCAGGMTLEAIKLDLVVQGVAEHHEEDPGAFICINADNDNGSPWVTGTTNTIPTVRDFQTNPIAAENDLRSLQLIAEPPGLQGEFRLRVVNSGEGRIRLWDTATKQTEIAMIGGQATFIAGELPSQVFVEGVENSAALRDVEVVFEFIPAGQQQPPCSDRAKLTVTPVVTDFSATTGTVIIGQFAANEPIVFVAYNPDPAIAHGIVYDATVNVTGAQGNLYFVQNVLSNAGDITYTQASGLPAISVALGGESFTDANNNGQWDAAEPFEDLNGNGQYDQGEPFTDQNGNGQWDPSESFEDQNFNGQFDIQYSFPLLDALANPPPATNIFVPGGPATVQGQVASLSGHDSPGFTLPNVFQIKTIDVLLKLETWASWRFPDGTLWPLASIEWQVHFEALRVQVPEGEELIVGPNAGVTASPMTRNHIDPWVVPPVAAYSGTHWE